MKTELVLLLATIGIVASSQHAQAQHGHLNAGAVSTNQNAQLIWANGADFIASSGYVFTLSYTNGDRFAGYYQGNITLTALPQTPGNAGPDPAAAALGAFLQFSMACLEGPSGGCLRVLGCWQHQSEPFARARAEEYKPLASHRERRLAGHRSLWPHSRTPLFGDPTRYLQSRFHRLRQPF